MSLIVVRAELSPCLSEMLGYCKVFIALETEQFDALIDESFCKTVWSSPVVDVAFKLLKYRRTEILFDGCMVPTVYMSDDRCFT
mmetsp:Transcript_16909/g.49477  ORF Transcript_16909/g.49477 Transcript_16909/m.49477 type:complete len:84 (-) Transcript_16909:984-1235(-)